MGVDSYAYIVTGEQLRNLPKSMSEYLKENMQEIELFGKPVYVQCGIELDEYFWDGLELDDNERRYIIEKLVEKEDSWSIEECREDYDTKQEYIEACLDNYIPDNTQEFIEEYVPELIRIVSDFDWWVNSN